MNISYNLCNHPCIVRIPVSVLYCTRYSTHLNWTFNYNFTISQTEPAGSSHFAWHSLSICQLMHHQYVSRARGKKGQAIVSHCQAWIPVCNYNLALAPSRFSSEFRSFNIAQIIIPTERRERQNTAPDRIRKRWSRWPKISSWVTHTQLRPLRYIV